MCFVTFAVSETSGSTLPVTTDQEAVSKTTDESRSSALTGRVEVLWGKDVPLFERERVCVGDVLFFKSTVIRYFPSMVSKKHSHVFTQ